MPIADLTPVAVSSKKLENEPKSLQNLMTGTAKPREIPPIQTVEILRNVSR
jgi:hypothetical protein